MKKILIAILGLSLFAATALAQDTGGDKNQKGKNKAKPAKTHKAKSKKGSGSTTPPPK